MFFSALDTPDTLHHSLVYLNYLLGDTESLLEEIVELHDPGNLGISLDSMTTLSPVPSLHALARLKRSTVENMRKTAMHPCCKDDPDCLDKLRALKVALDALEKEGVIGKLGTLQKDLTVLSRVASQLNAECHAKTNG